MASFLDIGLWNTEFAAPGTARGTFLAARLQELAADVICVTEGRTALLPPGGHIASSDADYGYRLVSGRRKVLLWSLMPWRDVDTLGTPGLPAGRFVAGTTATTLGDIRFVGVCVPWSAAHVSTGRKDRRRWEDHLTYLAELREVLVSRSPALPTIVLGDFNQCVPRGRQPLQVSAALLDCFRGGFEFATAGSIPDATGASIDHLVHTPELRRTSVKFLSNYAEDGRRMSDHFGLRISMERA